MLDAGASQALVRGDSLEAALGENSVDVVIDLVGGEQWTELLNILRPFGRYAVSGAIAGPNVALELRTLYLTDQRVIGCTVMDEEVLSRLVNLIEPGEIKPLLARLFPLEYLSEAQPFFLEKRFTGKLVIDVAL